MSRNHLTLIIPFLFLACDPDDTSDFEADDDSNDGEISEREGQVNPCAALTPAAIQSSIDRISQSITLTEQYLQETPNSHYSGAGEMARNALEGARGFIVAQQTAAAALGLPAPYMVHQGVNADSFLEWSKSAHWLTDAVWWSYIAAAYDRSETVHLANQRAIEAKTLVIELSNQANLCAATFVAPCGNGILQAGEQCDDGNLQNGDGCDSTCHIAVCGNGLLESTEQCDDGNTIGDDGCEQCKTKTSSGTVYFHSQSSYGTFARYNAATNAWQGLTTASGYSAAPITNDGKYVYRLTAGANSPSTRNRIYRFDPDSGHWSEFAAGPQLAKVGELNSSKGEGSDIFAWTGDGFIFINKYTNGGWNHPSSHGFEIWVAKNVNNTWVWELTDTTENYPLDYGGGWWAPTPMFHAASWDVLGQKLNVEMSVPDNKTPNIRGTWQVDALGEIIHNVAHSYRSQGCAFSRGKKYCVGEKSYHGETIVAFDSPTTTLWSNAGQPSYSQGAYAGSYLYWDVDHANGDIYMMGRDHFRRYDPDTNVLTPLSTLGSSYQIDLSSITVMRPQ